MDPPKELELLKGISGYAVPGKLMALMGGSGAGTHFTSNGTSHCSTANVV
jgi:ABC-type histidine transport system ATPase subunit